MKVASWDHEASQVGASVAWMECKRNPGWDDAERLYSRPRYSHPEYYGAPCDSGPGYPWVDITIRGLTLLLARESYTVQGNQAGEDHEIGVYGNH